MRSFAASDAFSSAPASSRAGCTSPTTALSFSLAFKVDTSIAATSGLWLCATNDRGLAYCNTQESVVNARLHPSPRRFTHSHRTHSFLHSFCVYICPSKQTLSFPRDVLIISIITVVAITMSSVAIYMLPYVCSSLESIPFDMQGVTLITLILMKIYTAPM